MKPYTYLIKHKPTGLVYYGVRTANKVDAENDLWKEYFTSSKKIHALIEETGTESFEIEVRREFDSIEAASAWEVQVLKRCKVLEDLRWINANVAGYIFATEEIRAKISAFHKGKPKSEEHKQKISEANKGKEKRPLTEEEKETLSQIMKGEGNPMFGKKHSSETLAKISAARKGQPGHPAWNKGIPTSEETKIKMRGRKDDPAVIKQRAETLKAKKLKREKKECPHCSKIIPVNIFARYHGDRCKNKS
jgi:ribosomal protein S27AE